MRALKYFVPRQKSFVTLDPRFCSRSHNRIPSEMKRRLRNKFDAFGIWRLDAVAPAIPEGNCEMFLFFSVWFNYDFLLFKIFYSSDRPPQNWASLDDIEEVVSLYALSRGIWLGDNESQHSSGKPFLSGTRWNPEPSSCLQLSTLKRSCNKHTMSTTKPLFREYLFARLYRISSTLPHKMNRMGDVVKGVCVPVHIER